jgi:anaphase-promoting complex subunit 8
MDVSTVKVELRKALRDVTDRGLLNASKWIAELLFSIKASKEDRRTKSESIDNSDDEDIYLYAKSLFDLKEFARASFHLSKIQNPSSKALFLKFYSKWLHAEKVREQESHENNGIKKDNREVENLYTQLVKLPSDPFLEYLKGIILKSIVHKDEAIACFINSVTAYPLMWSSWMELSQLCVDKEVFERVLSQLNTKHWITNFFIAKTKKDLQLNLEALECYKVCQSMFPTNTWISNEIALTLYYLSEFQDSEKVFLTVRANDPYCLDQTDTYSNLLFVTGETTKLSVLAHEAQSIDKYRLETCLIIGNYYAKLPKHDKAITYFRRALKVDPLCVSAWTLMGHEYVELSNSEDAIKCYRKAIEINPKDYRAWSGLGSTYELLEQYLHAMYHYQKALAIRPYQGRFWCALGNCYEHLKRFKDALRCYDRAVKNDDPDGIALYKMANLYKALDQPLKAVEMWESLIRDKTDFDTYESTEVQALLELAQHYRDNANFEKATYFCDILLGLDVPQQEQAKSIMKEIRNFSRNQRVNLPF